MELMHYAKFERFQYVVVIILIVVLHKGLPNMTHHLMLFGCSACTEAEWQEAC